MTQLPMRDGLILAGILFSLGLTGLLVRRNLIFVLMSLEVMLNAAGLALVLQVYHRFRSLDVDELSSMKG